LSSGFTINKPYYLDECDREPYEHYTCGLIRKKQQVLTRGNVVFVVGLKHKYHDVDTRIGIRFGEKFERIEQNLELEEDPEYFGGEPHGTAFAAMVQWSMKHEGVEENGWEKDHDWCDFLRGHGEWDEEEEPSDWNEWERQELLPNPQRRIEYVADERNRREWLEEMLLERGLQEYDTQTPLSHEGL